MLTCSNDNTWKQMASPRSTRRDCRLEPLPSRDCRPEPLVLPNIRLVLHRYRLARDRPLIRKSPKADWMEQDIDLNSCRHNSYPHRVTSCASKH
jgi:hypothetical protein